MGADPPPFFILPREADVSDKRGLVVIGTRVPATVRVVAEQAAADRGITLSEWTRQAIVEKAVDELSVSAHEAGSA